MIWESSYWKEELLRLADKIARRRRQRRFSERSLANLEKEIFFAFYAIRKLIEAKKLTQRVVNRSISVKAYPTTSKGVTIFNWGGAGYEIEKYFDVTKGTRDKVTLSFLCNQFIHSYIFIPEFSGNGLARILIASDHMRKRKLYCVKIGVIETILRKIAFDRVFRVRAIYDSQIGDYVLKND